MTNKRELFIEISNQQVTEGDEVVGYLVKNSRMNELEKALSVPAQHVIPDEITSASAPEVFEIAAEAGRLGIRGTYGVYAVGWNACRSEMLKAQPVSEPYKLPSGYALVPCKLTAENGAKSCMIGEFTEQTEISCPECFGDDECETCDGSGMIEVTVPVSWTTIKDIWAKGIEHFAAAPAQESE